MNVLIITIFGRFIASIYAESNIAYYNPNTKEFKIKIDNGSTMISSAMTTDSATTATSDSTNNSRISTTESSTTLLTYPTGEPSPTRSAQLGMGLGITLIGVLLIGEIIYFKYFYRGSLRTDNYLA